MNLASEPKNSTNKKHNKTWRQKTGGPKLKARRLKLKTKIEIDRNKFKWTVISVIVAGASIAASAAVGAIGIRETANLQGEAARTQFALKAAELVLQSDDPAVNANKAHRFQVLFPEQMQPDWPDRLDWKKFTDENDDMKIGLVKLLAKQPKERSTIIAEYRQLFGSDDNVQCFFDRLTGESHVEHKCKDKKDR
jgi:hypothetical protein